VSAKYQYLSLLAMCLLGTAFLEFRFQARVWRRPVAYLKAIAIPFVLFNFVNEMAVWRRLWSYSALYTSGIRIPRAYPIEEVLFFLAIPMCALLTFEAATNVYEGRVKSIFGAVQTPVDQPDEEAPRPETWKTIATAVILAISATLLLLELWLQRGRLQGVRGTSAKVLNRLDFELPEYTVLAVLLMAAVCFLEFAFWHSGVFRLRAYWSTMAICLGFMVLVNGWLTKLSAPIVIYAEDEFSGWRPIWDIPFEDFPFGIAMLTLVLMGWVKVTKPKPTQPTVRPSARHAAR
jgi:lycopene cyclase domain-containing protein